MQPLTLTSNNNFNPGYYSSNLLNQMSLECDSPDNKSNSVSPKLNYNQTKVSDRSESPIVCELQKSSQLKDSVISQTVQYLNVANLTKNLTKNLVNNQQLANSKMSKPSSNHSLPNNENNINKHNIINNLTVKHDGSIHKQLLTPIVRFRRLLTSIYQHANDISPETGDQVHTLILELINSTCSIDDFQIKIQELINYPLRSHIINFIRVCLLSIQNEIGQLARLSKQSVIQFVKQNESVFLETNLNNSLKNGLNTLIDLDEFLLSNSMPNHQLKRRYSPDFLLDNENQLNKRFHSLKSASPMTKFQNSTGQHSAINQSIGNQVNTSKMNNDISSVMNNAAVNLSNPTILQNHLIQARTAKLEELMSNRFYQTPTQQQFNAINQHLNQQIHVGQNKPKQSSQHQPNSNLLHANGIGQMSGGNQLGNHLQNNLILNNQLNKQQLERLALLERYDKEMQNKHRRDTNNLLNSHIRSNGLTSSSITLPQQQSNLLNPSSNLNVSISNQHQFAQKSTNPSNEMNNEEEWKTIDTMLNCIITMVEKTKRALNVLQQKNQENFHQHREQHSSSPLESTDWQRVKLKQQQISINNKNLNIDVQSNLITKSASPPIIALDIDYLDLRKSKDQLFSTQNFANTNSILKTPLNRINAQTDLMSIEKNKTERLFNSIGRQAAQDLLIKVQDESAEACWNCGRKAVERCSGCNEAKYCNSFCQHKDWKNHHLTCGKANEQTKDYINKMNNDIMTCSPDPVSDEQSVHIVNNEESTENVLNDDSTLMSNDKKMIDNRNEDVNKNGQITKDENIIEIEKDETPDAMITTMMVKSVNDQDTKKDEIQSTDL